MGQYIEDLAKELVVGQYVADFPETIPASQVYDILMLPQDEFPTEIVIWEPLNHYCTAELQDCMEAMYDAAVHRLEQVAARYKLTLAEYGIVQEDLA